MKLKLFLVLFLFQAFLFSQNKNLNNSLKIKLNAGDNFIQHTILVQGNISKLISSQKDYNYKFN